MRAPAIILAAICSVCLAGSPIVQHQQQFVPQSASPSYLINEGFEEVNSGGALGSATDGYDSPLVSGTNGANVVNNWSPALVGNYSLQLSNTTGYAFWRQAGSNSEAWAYFRCSVGTLTASNPHLLQFRDPAGNIMARIRLMTAGGVRIYQGTSFSLTTATVSPNTTNHFWLHWKNDGTADGGFTTDGTYPSGNNWTNVTGGSGTAMINTYRLLSDEGALFHREFDQFLVSTNGSIGSNP